MLKVAGQVRLQELFWLAQLAKQASVDASASRSLPVLDIVPAIAVPIRVKHNAALNRIFIRYSESGCRSQPHSK